MTKVWAKVLGAKHHNIASNNSAVSYHLILSIYLLNSLSDTTCSSGLRALQVLLNSNPQRVEFTATSFLNSEAYQQMAASKPKPNVAVLSILQPKDAMDMESLCETYMLSIQN